jgi:hypothetical protein
LPTEFSKGTKGVARAGFARVIGVGRRYFLN